MHQSFVYTALLVERTNGERRLVTADFLKNHRLMYDELSAMGFNRVLWAGEIEIESRGTKGSLLVAANETADLIRTYQEQIKIFRLQTTGNHQSEDVLATRIQGAFPMDMSGVSLDNLKNFVEVEGRRIGLGVETSPRWIAFEPTRPSHLSSDPAFQKFQMSSQRARHDSTGLLRGLASNLNSIARAMRGTLDEYDRTEGITLGNQIIGARRGLREISEIYPLLTRMSPKAIAQRNPISEAEVVIRGLENGASVSVDQIITLAADIRTMAVEVQQSGSALPLKIW